MPPLQERGTCAQIGASFVRWVASFGADGADDEIGLEETNAHVPRSRCLSAPADVFAGTARTVAKRARQRAANVPPGAAGRLAQLGRNRLILRVRHDDLEQTAARSHLPHCVGGFPRPHHAFSKVSRPCPAFALSQPSAAAVILARPEKYRCLPPPSRPRPPRCRARASLRSDERGRAGASRAAARRTTPHFLPM
jgi:hypothetical protein